MNLTQDKEQLELLRFIQILDNRIQSLEEEVKVQEQALLSQASMLRSLENQKNMLLKETPLPFKPCNEEWIHVGDCAHYEDLPQPSTVRQWIREGLLSEGTDYKKVGARGKLFIKASSLVAIIERDKAK